MVCTLCCVHVRRSRRNEHQDQIVSLVSPARSIAPTMLHQRGLQAISPGLFMAFVYSEHKLVEEGRAKPPSLTEQGKQQDEAKKQ